MTPDDFYIGYETPVPRRARPRIAAAIGAALGTALVLAVTLVAGQGPFADASFAFGDVREFTGVIRMGSIDAPEPRLDAGDGRYLLVAPGKHGAADLVRAYADRRVRLAGTLIARDADRMIQVEPAGLVDLGAAPDDGESTGGLTDRGEQTFAGEIVDAKCHLGVMNPGEGTVHRDCAGVCIRGGIPALLLVRLTDGGTRRLLIVDADGHAVAGRPLHDRLVRLAGRPVVARGRLLAGAGGTDWRLALTHLDPARR